MSEILAEIPERFWEDEAWAYENYSDLLRLYPNRWIAIVDKKVVAVSDGSGNILKEAKAKTGEKHVPIVFLEDGSHVY